MTDANTVAFIPARGGSKGVPDKNIKSIAGKPLIAWSIEQALSATLVDKVYVSTDCPSIAEIAREYGAQTPFLRPSEIANDTASTESAMLHFVDFLGQNDIQYKNILLLQATSPVRAADTIDRAIRFFNAGGFDSVLSVTESHRFFWRNPAYPQALYDYKHRPRRQDISQDQRSYMETGSLYITNIHQLVESANRLCGRIGLFVTDESESFEIDSLMDFCVCEAILHYVNAKESL